MTSSISGTGGSLSAAYLKQMQEQMFKKADKNSDGSITKDELSQMQSSQKSQNGPSVDDIFAQMDSDSDGAISRLESDAGIAKLAQQMQSRKTDDNSSSDMKEQVFSTADQNGDGGISKDELSQLLENSSQNSTDVTAVFDALDTNKDGSISKSESDAAVDKAGQQMQAQGPPPPRPPADSSSSSSDSTSTTQIFDAMDTNEDGTVSASELFAALANKDSSSSDSSSSDNSSSSSSASGDNSTVKKIFDAMDTNEDGSVSKAELEEALAKAGQQMQTQGAPPSMAQGTADSSATDATSSKDSALFASAIKSYMQASISSFSQSSNEATFSSSAVYG